MKALPGCNQLTTNQRWEGSTLNTLGQATTSFFTLTIELLTCQGPWTSPGPPLQLLKARCLPVLVFQEKKVTGSHRDVSFPHLSRYLCPSSFSQPPSLSPQPFPLQDPVLPSAWEGLHRCGASCSVCTPTMQAAPWSCLGAPVCRKFSFSRPPGRPRGEGFRLPLRPGYLTVNDPRAHFPHPVP